MSAWPFEPLQMFGYDLIVADPPWDFELYSEKGEKKSARRHYATMPLGEIMALPVGQLAQRDCLLLLWCCEWMPPAQRDAVLGVWGFTYKTTIIWQKLTVNGKQQMGPGYRARTMHEPCIIATLGRPKQKALPSLFSGEAREHSRKPEEFYRLVEKCSPGSTRADLFSRAPRRGWDGWGRESTKFAGGAA